MTSKKLCELYLKEERKRILSLSDQMELLYPKLRAATVADVKHEIAKRLVEIGDKLKDRTPHTNDNDIEQE